MNCILETGIHINELEMVQNRAIRWIFGKSPREKLSVTALRKQLSLQTLEQRRRHSRLCLFQKVVHGHVVVTVEDLGLELSEERNHIHDHTYTHRHKGQKSMVARTVPIWNKLASSLVEASSPETFKSGLEALCP